MSMYGFEIGLDDVRVIRSKLSIHVGGQEAAQALPTATPLAGVDAGLRRRLEESERRADTLMRTNASLTSQLQDAEKSVLKHWFVLMPSSNHRANKAMLFNPRTMN